MLPFWPLELLRSVVAGRPEEEIRCLRQRGKTEHRLP